MRSSLRVAVLLSSLLAGCAESPTQGSDGSYQLSAKATPAQGGASAASRMALKNAATFCRSKSKQLHLMRSTVQPGGATVTFLCG
jgi:hypothetical protein